MSDSVWKVTKRDGREEQFSQDKIINAVRKCFINGVKASNDNADGIARDICNKVLNIMRRSKKDLWDIEDIQRLVIQQLWACNYFDAAEHYTIYREQRRKEREVVHTISSEEAELMAKDVAHFNSDLRYYQFLSKYSRWNEKAKRRETWREACDRVMNFMKSRPQLKAIEEDVWQELDEGLYNHEATCALRVLQMAGPALERCNMGAYNCTALDINCLEAFSETLYILMQGCGVGFSVEGECIDQLPRIKKQRNQPPIHHQIEDSTEGWCDALLKGLKTWFIGHDVIFDYSLIRLAGALLKTKGGRASGPEPLKQLLVFVRTKVLTKQGSRLTDVDCHDILCMTGKIVHLGGVRRAAEISISDLDSEGMRLAKFGPWYETAPWRDMSNNSTAYNEKPDCITFMKEWLSLAESGSGERGIFNRFAINQSIPKRRKRVRFLINPCGEIMLRNCQCCNLSIAVARYNDTKETLRKKVRVATIWGTIQATLTDFNYVRPIWRANCLTGSTKVALLNGQNVQIKDLVGQKGFWVYSYDLEKEKMVPGYAHSVRMTSKSETIVRVTLDSGDFLECTFDHRVLLRSGEYKEAGKLKSGDSLMPLYRRLSTKEDDSGRVGYEMCSTGRGYKFTHVRTASMTNIGTCAFCEVGLPDDKHWLRHHIDFNKLNNEPTNIQWLTRKEHNKLHSDIMKALWEDPKFRAKMSEVAKRPKKPRKKTPEYEKWRAGRSEHLYEVVTELWKDLNYRKRTLERLRIAHKKYVQTEEFRKMQSERLKILWADPAFVEKFMNAAREGIKNKWKDPKYRAKMSEVSKSVWTEEHKKEMKPKQSRNGKLYGSQNLLAYNKSEKGRKRSGDNLRYERTPEHLAKMAERSRKTAHEYWHVRRGIVSSKCLLCSPNNHKVVKVETLNRKEAVYDLTVDKYHNFALSNGVFVHNCEEERLLGVDIPGQQDCALLRYGAPGRAELLRELKQVVLDTNAEFADPLSINRTVAGTCGKPGGNSGQFFQCSSGGSTRYSKWQIRRFRASLPANDPLTKFMVEQGVNATVDPFNPSLTVLDMLPEPAPPGSLCRNDLTALQQLEYWLETKENWAEHSISCTIYVEPHEWLDVGQWVYKNFDKVNSIAFLPKDGGTYQLMPNEEVTEEEYLKLKANFPKIDWSKLSRYEQEDYTNAAQEVACTAQGCET